MGRVAETSMLDRPEKSTSAPACRLGLDGRLCRSAQMTLQRRVYTRDILDWYDGIVLALVTTSWRPGLFLLSLVAWDHPRGQRVYGLVPIEESDGASIQQISNRWVELKAYLASLLGRLNEGASVILLDDSTEDVLAEADLPIEAVRGDLFLPVEDALEPERQKWFGYFGMRT